ncbi:hypothetical protein [Christiangramia crocea]|uniref:Uncharacterized protein n=1 Tax=Christiangramia crocea TaxID=2904124 RepID=A0A9X1UXB0_9FLAO|nr:hypothetical protein [Gramella crocea]MCG9972112.1 hypothetical protein [Gramella crocea]
MGQQISPSEAKKLLENWTKPGGPGKTMGPNYKDTYETYFTVAELKAYLEYVENNISDNPGVRIYFGSYGTGPGPKKGYNTVFLAPTQGGGDAEADVNLDEVQNNYSLDAYNSGGTKFPPDPYQ